MKSEIMKSIIITTIILLMVFSQSVACDCEPWYEKVEDWFKISQFAVEGEIISYKYIGNNDTVQTVNS